MTYNSIQEIIHSIDEEQQTNFFEFVTYGTFSNDFVHYLSNNKLAQSGIQMIYELQGKDYEVYMKQF